VPDLVGVVLDPAGLREVLRELAVGRGDDRAVDRTPVVPASMAITTVMAPRLRKRDHQDWITTSGSPNRITEQDHRTGSLG